jgi:hypothetical protein
MRGLFVELLVDYFNRNYIFLSARKFHLRKGNGLPPKDAAKRTMTHAYVIQIAGRTAGIVARDHAGQAFHFFASNQVFRPLEGFAFPEAHLAERAAREIHKRGFFNLPGETEASAVARSLERNPPARRKI